MCTPTGLATGSEMPAAQVMWSRLREVEIHHVDIGAGYGPSDWPEAFRMDRLTKRILLARAAVTMAEQG